MNIITQFMEATTQREVDKIVEKYMDLLSPNQRCKLCQWGNNAKRRINRIDREKKESFKNILN